MTDVTHEIKLWHELGTVIRKALHPERSDAFVAYFTLGEQISTTLPIDKQWQLYLSQLHLLLTTIEDPKVPAHWRRMCFECVHRPLLSLKKISNEYAHGSKIRDLYIAVNQQLNTAFTQTPF
ncbi:MAG: hypothetical protein HRU23_08000 [Gammaproteobacteria bacterium]|nr:hypothetical protein [Gammaproteobacteria bacterium]